MKREAPIETQLKGWDGRSTDWLRALARSLPEDEGTISALLAGAKSPMRQVSVGSTWILKQFQDAGMTFDADQTRSLIHLLREVSEPEGVLHLLQILGRLELPGSGVTELWRRLLLLSEHRNTFVRAFAFGALYHAADRHAALRPRCAEHLTEALLREPASVRARIRNAAKKSSWFPL
ncbi:MAG TPA: hypothetical protein PKA37_14800 [Planctomycetota bacterium]|nr:hypothetical protein [Planctomycetota bacterium]